MSNRTLFISSVAVLSVSFIWISIPRSLTHPPSLSLGNDVRNVAHVSSLDLILMWHLYTHTVFFCLSQQHKNSLLSHTQTTHTDILSFDPFVLHAPVCIIFFRLLSRSLPQRLTGANSIFFFLIFKKWISRPIANKRMKLKKKRQNERRTDGGKQ